jgi:glycosyltransferase involved in cell wall biosynthesis
VADAVRSVLDQTFGDLELLVIDDGSTDDTAANIRSSDTRLRVLRQENSGVARARNRGLAEARGAFVAFLDADDTWAPQKLERQLAAMRSRSAPASFTAYDVVDASLLPLASRRYDHPTVALGDLLVRGNVVFIGTVICSQRILEQAGAFDATLSQCADWDMWIRVATLTEFAYVDEVLASYRQHTANMSRDARLLEHDSVRVLKKAYADPALPPALAHTRRQALGRMYMVCAGTYHRAGLRGDFTRAALRALWLSPRQLPRLLGYPGRAWRRRGEAGL